MRFASGVSSGARNERGNTEGRTRPVEVGVEVGVGVGVEVEVGVVVGVGVEVEVGVGVEVEVGVGVGVEVVVVVVVVVGVVVEVALTMSKLKGTRLDPATFTLTTARALEASKRGLDVNETWGEFCDYWTALPGAKALKLDWDATWRNWCRKARSFAKPWQLNVSVSMSQARTAKDQADIAALHARRGALGIGNFRDIGDGESVSDYRRAQDTEWTESRDRRLRIVK